MSRCSRSISYDSTDAIACCERAGSPRPEITDQLCAIESMRHSTFCADPSGVPSSKYARRYHAPSHAASSGVFEPRRVRPIGTRLLRVAARVCIRRERSEQRGEKPAEPDAFAAPLLRPLRPCRRSSRRCPSAATHGRPSASSARLHACNARKSRSRHRGARAFRTRCARPVRARAAR